MRSRLCASLCLLAVSCASLARGALVEEMFSAEFSDGEHRWSVPVLVVRPDDARRHPLVLLLHGRGVDATENRRIGRADFPANARYFTERGYAALIPTRIGYGIAGGPDLEDTGPCAHKSPLPALRRGAAEMKKVLLDVAAAPWADAAKIVVVGDSFGGLIGLSMAADPLAGLRGVVSLSAGDGGDSLRHVDQPCDPEALSAALAELGRKSQRPALLLYSANDRFWGPIWPERWYAAWHAAGGKGELIRLAADKNNGHFIFNRNPALWQAPVGDFLIRIGLP